MNPTTSRTSISKIIVGLTTMFVIGLPRQPVRLHDSAPRAIRLAETSCKYDSNGKLLYCATTSPATGVGGGGSGSGSGSTPATSGGSGAGSSSGTGNGGAGSGSGSPTAPTSGSGGGH